VSEDVLIVPDVIRQREFDQNIAALRREIAAVRDYAQNGFVGHEKAVQAALASADRAVAKAEFASEKRFEGVNEFRAALDSNQRNLMPRPEAERAAQVLSEKIFEVSRVVDRLQSERAGIRGGWGYAVGVFGFVLALLSVISIVMQFAGKP
jgi:hypothetical protein